MPVEEMHSFMDSLGVKFSKIVVCQGILETGWFQNSKVLEENNNWLGLKCAQHRKTYCLGTNLGHAVFESRAHCLLDYLEWQKKYIPRYETKFGPMTTDEDYYDFLLKWEYAEDKAYIRKLKKIKKQIYE